MKYLSIKHTVYPNNQPLVYINIPLDISKGFWTNFNEDKYLQVIEAKKSIK